MKERYSIYLAVTSGVLILLVTLLFALLQSSEILTGSVQHGRNVPHPIVGLENCDSCHGVDGIRPYPKDHLGWSNSSCTKCHFHPDASRPGTQVTKGDAKQPASSPKTTIKSVASSATKNAPRITHPIKGFENCMSCHDPNKGSSPAPADHVGRKNDSCTKCHAKQ